MTNSLLKLIAFAGLVIIVGFIVSGISKGGSQICSNDPAGRFEEEIRAMNREIESSAHEAKPNREPPSNPKEVLDKVLVREFSRPNKWGYKILWLFGPDIDPVGLTYNLGFLADLPNCKIDSLEKAEQLQAEIYATNIEIANSIREIRPFLGEFPLTPPVFDVSIGFLDEHMQFVDPPYLISVIMRHDKLDFYYFRKERIMHRFDEALSKPLNECPGLAPFFHPHVKRSTAQKKPKVPTYTSVPARHDTSYGKALFEFSKKITAQKKLYLVDFAEVVEFFRTKEPFQIAFWGHQCLKLDEARLLAASVSGQLLHFAKTDPEGLKEMKDYHDDRLCHIDTTIPDSRHISIRLSFWDENIDRQPEPYIAEVKLWDQKLCYYTADEGQVLHLAFEESFDEARAFLEASAGQ